MKVRFTVRARIDIEEIGTYVHARSPRGATRLRSALKRSIERIAMFPRHGRKQTVRDVRRVAAGKYPYNIYYRIDEIAQEIVILNIRHASRKRKQRDA